MKTFSYHLPETSPVIIPIADTHIGEELFDEEELIKYLKRADYIILNGDIMNTATKNSVSFSYGSNPQQDLDEATRIFEPYKDKILAVIEGNHEYRVSKEVGISLTQMFCLKLGIVDKYARDGAYLFINVGNTKTLYRIYATHGSGGGKSIGGKANGLGAMSLGVDADIYVRSHTHQPIVMQQDYIRSNPRKHTIQQGTQWFINTGAFLHYGGYAERFGFKPSTIITPVIVLGGNERYIRVFTDDGKLN